MSQVLESPGRVDTASAMSGDVESRRLLVVAAEIGRCLANERSSGVAWQSCPTLQVRHEGWTHADSTSGNMSIPVHHRPHAVLRMCLRKRESCMSVQGWRRTPPNEVGEVLNHSKMSSQQPHHETRQDQSMMTCELLLQLVTPKALLGSS